MLLVALLLSVAPAFFMLFFNYLLMNRSIDRWFSQPSYSYVTSPTEVALEMYGYAAANARAAEETLANSPKLVAAITRRVMSLCWIFFAGTK